MRSCNVLLCVGMLMIVGCGNAMETQIETSGGFFKTAWASLKKNNFRVNSPDSATGKFKDNPQAHQKGKMILEIAEDLSQVQRAELYLELWGGHQGTANKRFTLNGKSEYELLEVGTAEKNCTYSYPVIPLKLEELRRGANELQFTCEKGTSFWGHYIIRAACVRLYLKPGCDQLEKARLLDFHPEIAAQPAKRPPERIRLHLLAPEEMMQRIESVEYWGKYRGFDENGNRSGDDWHGYTLDRNAKAIIGIATDSPFHVDWDLSMIPDQKDMRVMGVIRFKDQPNLVYVTSISTGLPTPPRGETTVSLYGATDLPRPFASRLGRIRKCNIPLDVAPEQIERAELHVVVWDGRGPGGVPDPFTLNGHALDVSEWRGRHTLIYTVLSIPPKLLKRGDNEIRLLSRTEHHSIEILLPGPGLMVRKKR